MTTSYRAFDEYSEFVSGLFAPAEAISPEQARTLHAALGVAGEAGELADAIKKHVFYKQPLDVNNVIEEIGDILFYMQALLEATDIHVHPHATLFDPMLANVKKLKKRYHTGSYSPEQAKERADKKEYDPDALTILDAAPDEDGNYEVPDVD
jgi:NTP pyrophosphatase (non-canonical NTP hydrolase)